MYSAEACLIFFDLICTTLEKQMGHFGLSCLCTVLLVCVKDAVLLPFSYFVAVPFSLFLFYKTATQILQ